LAERKRITILQVIHGLHIGGAENVVTSLTRTLDPDQFNVVIYCITAMGVLGAELVEEGYSVYSGLATDSAALKSGQSLQQVIEHCRPDIVHSHGTTALLEIAPRFMFHKHPPWIHTYHFGNYPNIRKRYLYAERLFSRFTDQLVAVSDFQKNTIIRTHWLRSGDIITIHNGVADPDINLSENEIQEIRQSFGFYDNDVVVGCIAVLSYQKGIPFLLKAIQSVISTDNRVKFLIVGGGDLQARLEEQATELGVQTNVVFAGWRSDALKLMQVFDIFILPSLWEAFSVVVLEAMASSRPMILTDVADHARIIRHGESGYIVPSEDSSAIAECILHMLASPEQARAMAQKAYEAYKQNFTISQMAINYGELYKRMMQY